MAIDVKSLFNTGKLDPLITATGSMAGRAISGGMSTGAGSALQGLGDMANAIPGPWGKVASAGLNLIGGVVNRLWGSSINEEAVNSFKDQNRQLGNTIINAGSNDDFLSQYSGVDMLSKINKDDVGTEGIFSDKVTNLTNELNADRALAQNRFYTGAENSLNNMRTNSRLGARLVANGGPLFTHGGIFDNGLTYINNGGTHEENPFEGVPMGIDTNGTPNLVEEGEVVFNDYVFSNRLKVPKSFVNKYKLGEKSITYAEAAKKGTKESEERPNDPISKRGLEAFMSALIQNHEEKRAKEEMKKQNKQNNVQDFNTYDIGGPFSHLMNKEFSSSIPGISSIPSIPNFGVINTKGIQDALSLKWNANSDPLNAVGPKSAMEEVIPTEKVTPVKGIRQNPLRYTPIALAGAAWLNDVFGGNEPDYSNVNTLQSSIDRINRPVRSRPVGDYLNFKPMDIMTPINQLNKTTAASKRAFANSMSGNRAAFMAGLAALDNNYGESLSKIGRQTNEYNTSREKEVFDFNRATNLTNAEQDLKADMFNTELLGKQAQLQANASTMRQNIYNANRAEKSANLTNFIQGLGDLGRELTDRDQLRWLADLGVLKYGPDGKYSVLGSKKKNNGNDE